MDKPRHRVKAGSSRGAAAAQPQRPAAQANAPAYQTTGSGPRSTSFRAGGHGPNAALMGAATLRQQARQLRRNSDMIETIVTKLAAHIVGTGIVPELGDQQAQERWNSWTDQADADGIRDFYGMLALAVEEMVEAGECFIRRRPRRVEDGLIVPLQLQLLEAEHVPLSLHRTRDGQGNETRFGIQFNAIGQRTGYWMYRTHPGDGSGTMGEPVLVPASEIIHLYHPKRIGQLRGVTWLAPMLGKIRDLEDFEDSTRLREAVNAAFTAFVTRNLPAEMDPEKLMQHWATVDAQSAQSGMARAGLEGGTTWFLEVGEDVKFAAPPGVSGTYEPFKRSQLRGIAAASMLLYEQISGDFSQVNDRMWRAAHNEFKRGIEMIQHNTLVFQALRPVMQWWGALGRLSGALPASLRTDIVPWTPQAWPYINPVQDVAAAEGEIRAGLGSRTRRLRERGERAEEVDAENKADRVREQDAKLTYTTDPAKVSNAGVTQARNPDVEIPG